MRKIILDLDEFDEDVFEHDDVYSEGYREELIDNDEMTLEEDAFMKGYEEAS